MNFLRASCPDDGVALLHPDMARREDYPGDPAAGRLGADGHISRARRAVETMRRDGGGEGPDHQGQAGRYKRDGDHAKMAPGQGVANACSPSGYAFPTNPQGPAQAR